MSNNPLADHPNVAAHNDEPPDIVSNTVKELSARILHILGIYPKISNSMLQVALGTSISPSEWKPILESLKQQGVVQEVVVSSTTPAGRFQTYRVISLTT